MSRNFNKGGSAPLSPPRNHPCPWLIAAAENVVDCANGDVCDFRTGILLVTAFELQFIAHVHELCTRFIIYA